MTGVYMIHFDLYYSLTIFTNSSSV